MFEKVNSKVVKVDVARAGGVVARTGAMLFYTGDVRFAPHQVPGANQLGGLGGFGRMAGRMMQGEHERTMLAQGYGEVHYGFAGLDVHAIELAPGMVLRAEASRLLATPPGCRVRWYRWRVRPVVAGAGASWALCAARRPAP